MLQIHHPGDVIGIPDVAYERAVTGLQAATDICLCPFPKIVSTRFFATRRA
ncbi:hypothetical protein ACFQ4K_29085 [Tistrella bauzanensis]